MCCLVTGGNGSSAGPVESTDESSSSFGIAGILLFTTVLSHAMQDEPL